MTFDPKPSMPPAPDPLPDLLRSLRSAAASDRLRAAKDLGRLGWLARDAAPALVAAVSDPDAKVREAAAQALGQMGPEALPSLCDLLSHPDKYVRRQAVWALARYGPLARPALRVLCDSLRDGDPRTASGAAQALGNMGSDGAAAVNALAEAMRGTNIVLCRLAAKALSQIGTPALSTLIAHLQHSDPFVRGESALAIGWIGPTARSAVPFLAGVVRGPRGSAVRKPSPQRSGSVPHDLGELDCEAPTPTEVPADTGSPDENCRVFAAQALGRIGAPAAPVLDVLREAARTGTEPLRAAAEQAIRQIRGT